MRLYRGWFPKIRGTFLVILIIRTIVYWGLYWGPLILGNYNLLHVVSDDAVHRGPDR